MDYGALSLLPPLVSIALALLTKEVVFSLFGGVFVWQMIKIGDFSPFGALYGSIEAIVGLFAEGWVVKSIVFIVLVGSILTIVVESGGVSAFVRYLTERSNRVKSKKGALLLGYFIGITIFIESTITSLVVGSVTAPLADRFGASRAKVAYLCDATSAPVCSLIPLNGWGGAAYRSGICPDSGRGIDRKCGLDSCKLYRLQLLCDYYRIICVFDCLF